MTSPAPARPATPAILIVDDDAGQRSLLHSFLAAQGFQTFTADSGAAALALLETQPVQMVISDVRMPGMSGLETLRRARVKYPRLPVLLVTAYADVRDAVHAMRDGAVDYLEKPIDLDEFLATVRRVTGMEAAAVPTQDMGAALPPSVVVRSSLMRQVFRDAALVAGSDSRILITGESGVGKEIVADVIHGWSQRASGALVKVNCAAIPEDLLESELFGHEKGAFTGAVVERLGRFEEANDGTILLDEIAELSPRLQAKLLRITQDGRFQRVGSNKDLHTHARILAATNRNLEIEVERGAFREDLFYRLNVIEIFIPPLRERREDIFPLATEFLSRFSERKFRFSNTVVACLEGYDWPGNVRELQNAMERASLLCHGDVILPEHLPARVRSVEGAPKAAPAPQQAQRLEEMERQTILQALKEHENNRTETARALGISRRSLIYKLRLYRESGFDV